MTTYRSTPTVKLTDVELKQCYELFSNHYGVYSEDDPKGRKGRHIKTGAAYCKERYVKDNYHVALAIDSGNIVGQAFYIREKLEEGIYTWVLQLVVHEDYRNRGIAGRLLHSIWGFSNDCAWGLATTNPYTVKTLERTTFRHADPQFIKEHDQLVRKICHRIPYVQELFIDDSQSKAFTDFYVDTDSVIQSPATKDFDWLLGKLEPGEEWIAFTFRDQEYDEDFLEELKIAISYSEDVLKDAYSRMDMDSHSWAKHSQKEIEAIEAFIGPLDNKSILDAGCGHGRHSLELAKKYPRSQIVGIDFSESNIKKAAELGKDISNVEFHVGDLKQPIEGTYDVILCLYDVVGSFPQAEDNKSILQNLYDVCHDNGLLVLSVMNMEFTLANAKKEHIVNIDEHPEMLFKLPASDIMQTTGDIFNPDYYLVDEVHGIVYRKEQFSGEGALPSEYVIRDRRFTMQEITELLESV
jgi:2-polyprenyl-3-methyl-5-hydroxy-6-metoxy-1,4-benzoquinol methylase/GNAT superfamily N-acetyltransferase